MPTQPSNRAMDAIDIGAAVLCLVGFVFLLVRHFSGEPTSWWSLVSLPIIAALAFGRLASRHKRASSSQP